MKKAVKHRSPARTVRRSGRRGAAAVEFALIAPLAFSFFAAIIIFAQAYLLRDTAQHAAYEGARSVIMPGASRPTAEAAAQRILNTVGARSATVDVQPQNLTTSTRNVTVTVQIPMGENLWIRAPWLPDDWNVQTRLRSNAKSNDRVPS